MRLEQSPQAIMKKKLLSLKIPSFHSRSKSRSRRESRTVEDEDYPEPSMQNDRSSPTPVLNKKTSDDDSLFSGLYGAEIANISPPPPPKGAVQPKGILRASSHTGPSSLSFKTHHSATREIQSRIDSESTLGNSTFSTGTSSRMKGTYSREIATDPSIESIESELLKTIEDIAEMFPDGDTNTLMTWGSANEMQRPLGVVKLVSSVKYFGKEAAAEARNEEGQGVVQSKSSDSGSGIAEILDNFAKELEADIIEAEVIETNVSADFNEDFTTTDTSAIRVGADTTDILHDDEGTDILPDFSMDLEADRSEIQMNAGIRTTSESDEGTEVLADFNRDLTVDAFEKQTDTNGNSFIENDEGTEVLADFNRDLMSHSVEVQPKETESKYFLTPNKARKMQKLLEKARTEVEILHGNNGQYQLEIERIQEEHISELNLLEDRAARELDELRNMHQNEIEDITREKDAAVTVARDIAAQYEETEKQHLKTMQDAIDKVKRDGSRELSEAIEKERQIASLNREMELAERSEALRQSYQTELDKMRRECDERIEIEVEKAVSEAHRSRLKQDGLVSRMTIEVDDLRKDRDSIFELLKQAKRKFNEVYPEEMAKFKAKSGFTQGPLDHGTVSYRNGEEALKDLMTVYTFLLENAEKKAMSARELSEIDTRKHHILRQRAEIEQLKKDKGEKNDRLRKLEEDFKALSREKALLEERYNTESEAHKLELKRLGNEKETFVSVERSRKDLIHAMAKGQRELAQHKEMKEGDKFGQRRLSGHTTVGQKNLPDLQSQQRTETSNPNNFDIRYALSLTTPTTLSSPRTLGFSKTADKKDPKLSTVRTTEKPQSSLSRALGLSKTEDKKDPKLSTVRTTEKPQSSLSAIASNNDTSNIQESSQMTESTSMRRTRSFCRAHSKYAPRYSQRDTSTESNDSKPSIPVADGTSQKPFDKSLSTAVPRTKHSSVPVSTKKQGDPKPSSHSKLPRYSQRDTSTESKNSKPSIPLADGTSQKPFDKSSSAAAVPRTNHSSVPVPSKKQGDPKRSPSKPVRASSSLRRTSRISFDGTKPNVPNTPPEKEKGILEETGQDSSLKISKGGPNNSILLQRKKLAGLRHRRTKSEEGIYGSMQTSSEQDVEKDGEEKQNTNLLQRARKFRNYKDDGSRRSRRSIDVNTSSTNEMNAKTSDNESNASNTQIDINYDSQIPPPPPPPRPLPPTRDENRKGEVPSNENREATPSKERHSRLNFEKPPLSLNSPNQSERAGRSMSTRFSPFKPRVRVRKI